MFAICQASKDVRTVSLPCEFNETPTLSRPAGMDADGRAQPPVGENLDHAAVDENAKLQRLVVGEKKLAVSGMRGRASGSVDE